ncbi:hypothetical protein [Thalassospira xiamenensis]|uniref:Uncharacterized protein n=1 Tax=Thalassospira xiamenensis TaxID=220697 RepID=A0A285TTP8_9PROT|nr:hypothetical protein [Thalassospira xiamenensis]SOC27346.1 hypothetical protein SAMN05428964_105387 [Thalassospira xiamenensis]
MSEELLGPRLLNALRQIPGSPEREHIISLLTEISQPFLLDEEVVRQAAWTVKEASETIEQTLPLLTLSQPVIWLEYPHLPRQLAFGVDESADEPGLPKVLRVGCLIAVDPEDPTHISIFVAWENSDGGIYHSYAMLHWRLDDFIKLAEMSRKEKLTTSTAERLTELAILSIPPGFRDEIMVWEGREHANEDGDSERVLKTKKDALGEHLFLLSALMLMASDATEATEQVVADVPETGLVDTYIPDTMKMVCTVSLSRKKAPLFERFRKPGFYPGLGLEPVLRWKSP